MRNMQVFIDNNSFDLIDAHFDLRARLKICLRLIFTGYLSFKSNRQCILTRNYPLDKQSEQVKE